ncbi:MAG TPA: hypothetical protein VGS22_08240 [Thermoanaerobaculia bacterium]|jgi:ELWxxDGT repeat protein|nr:hypothetical protein [Thermoanaerobaculia bacterium]
MRFVMHFVALASVAFSAALLAAAPAAAITPYRVADIDPAAVSLGSFPAGFASLGGRAIFSTEGSGEVWSSDGTAGGTVRIAEGYRVSVVANTGAVIYFVAAEFPEEDVPLRLWVTDGTAAGTVALLDDRPQSGFSFAFFPVPGTPRLYFSFDDGVHGLELWTSNGTVAGTRLVRDLAPGAAPGFTGFFGALAVVAGKAYFSGEDALGLALFSTDGTAAGTRRIRRFGAAGPGVRGPFGLVAFGNRLLFFVGTSDSGIESWVSDGTTTGTLKLAEVVPGEVAILRLTGFFVVGPLAYFVAGNESTGAELWRTNGTAAGTFRVTDFPTISPFRKPPYDLFIATLQGKVAFAADDGVHGLEPWVTDGTRAGTRLIRDVCPGACAGAAGPFLAQGAGLIFSGTADPSGGNVELWTSNLSAPGTHLLKDLCAGSCSSLPRGFVAVGNLVYLSALDPAGRRQLWRTNGHPQGTVRLTDVGEDTGLFPLGTFDVARAGSTLLFSAPEDLHRWEPWRTDGSRAGTRLLVDLPDPDFGGSSPKRFMKAGAKSFFFANDGVHGYELWSSDGTSAGTHLVRELIDGPEPAAAPPVPASAEAGGRLVFIRGTGFDTRELWGSDGTAGGTVPLLDERVIPGEILYPLGQRVVFLARDEEHGYEPWVTDGTKSGTRLLRDTLPGPDGSGAGSSPFNTLGGRLLFQGQAGPFDPTLAFWLSDGTPAGTVPLASVYPFLVEPLAELSSALVPLGGKTYFDRGSRGFETSRLWVTDLTAAGTREIGAVSHEPGWSTIRLYAAGSQIYAYGRSDQGFSLWATAGQQAGGRRLGSFLLDLDPEKAQPTAFSGKLFFRPFDSTTELWVTNGTAAGTRRVQDSSGTTIRDPRALRVLANQLICSTPNEFWRTNGTTAGTARVSRRRSPAGSHDLVVAGSRLFFADFDEATGTELWALRP